ncbi:MAG: hypothetical protein EOO05_20950 [Chitinophagaceae bacterium]|jgi:hypothetical protein|nr:MAG: hypothetical protein EOO05_20950 [Chitinophagaceae bacterium]
MHQRNFFRILFVAIAIGTIALVWPRPTNASGPEDSCRESMESVEKTDSQTGKLLWESLPNQFFSSF